MPAGRLTGLGATLAFHHGLLDPQDQTPTFRATTRVMELTVTALDKKGQPVTDLGVDDFAIQDNGKARPVAFLEYDGAPVVAADPLPLPPGVFTNRVEFTPGPARNVTAFVLDELNTPGQFSIRIRAAALRYLRALPPGTRMAVFHMSERLGVLHDFTDDTTTLRARVARAAVVMPLQGETDFDRSVIEAEQFVDLFKDDPQVEALKADLKRNQLELDMMANAHLRRSRLETTLESMEKLGQHLAGIPGRKNLVWISGGIQVIFAERSANGSTRLTTDTPTVKIPDHSWETAQREGLRHARRLKPARDTVSHRVIVRDMVTGRYGTLDVPLRTLPAR